MGVSTTHRINLSMWILIYSFSDTYYVWAACVHTSNTSSEDYMMALHEVLPVLGQLQAPVVQKEGWCTLLFILH